MNEKTLEALEEVGEPAEGHDIVEPMADEASASSDESLSERVQSVSPSNQQNFKAMREKQERMERELREAQMRLQSYEQAREQTPDPLDMRDDDLAEGRHIRALKKDLEVAKQELMAATIETRLKSSYPDFEKVVNDRTIESLKLQYPELAATLSSSHDMYNKAASAYTMIKRLGLYDNGEAMPEKSVKENYEKPRPAHAAAAPGSSPLQHANAFAQGLTPELAKRLRQEMADAIKNR